MSDKQPQTCYVPLRDKELIEKGSKMCSVFFGSNTEEYESVKQLNSVYIYTPEELEALKAKWMREAAEKALNVGAIAYGSQCCDIARGDKKEISTEEMQQYFTGYLNQHYPLPTNKH